MTAFAATFVNDKLVADAATDALALSVLTGIVKDVEFYEGKTDDELIVWASNHERSMRILADERDWAEVEEHRYEVHVIDRIIMMRAEVREHAAAVARFTAQVPLTHRPFDGLVLA